MRTFALLAVLPAAAALAPAQHILLMTSTSSSSPESTLALDLPEVDSIRGNEIYEVFPLPGVAYSARPFLPTSLQWHYVGDLDNDGQYVEASTDGPGGSALIDEIFVKAGTVGPVTPRDVYFSLSAASATFGVLASDVVRYAAQGVRDVFLTEAQLEVATGGTTLNLDALCQTLTGDLFCSFSLSEALHFGTAADGDLLYVPASAITYDGNGNVAAITANAAVRVATESQMLAMVTNSGFRQSNGTAAGTVFNLSGLELDPSGGTWVSPVDSLNYPNLLFCWRDSSNDGAVLSTAGGGTIAVINGVAMGSTVATTGAQLGWLPGTAGTAGPNGLALIPVQGAQFTLQNYPRNLHTQGDGQTFVQLQTSGGVPNGFTVLAWSVESNVPGGAFPSLPAVPPFVGDFGLLSPIIVGVYANDALGNTASPLIVLPTAVMSGVNLAAQALDLGTFQLSTPSAMSFL
jgi:hypothetical protein